MCKKDRYSYYEDVWWEPNYSWGSNEAESTNLISRKCCAQFVDVCGKHFAQPFAKPCNSVTMKPRAFQSQQNWKCNSQDPPFAWISVALPMSLLSHFFIFFNTRMSCSIYIGYICYTCMEVSKWVVNLIHPKFKLETVLKFNSLLSALRWHCHISVNKKRPKATCAEKKTFGCLKGDPKICETAPRCFRIPCPSKETFCAFFYASFLEGLEESLPRLLAWPKHGILWVVSSIPSIPTCNRFLVSRHSVSEVFFCCTFLGLNSHSYTFQAL